MDRVPVEIRLQIFTRACTDGGTTGRSLALVSRDIRETSREYCLQSVKLHGHNQARKFALMLDKRPMAERQIVDLHVQFDDDQLQLPEHAYVARDSELSAQLQLFNEQYEREIIGTVKRILLRLHPRDPMRTMTLSSDHISRSIPGACLEWPSYTQKLMSLTFNQSMSGKIFLAAYTTHKSPPSLQYLDMTGVDLHWLPGYTITNAVTAHIKYDLLNHIARIAPSLVYLRLKIRAVMMEKLRPEHWLSGHEIFGLSYRLPTTTMTVFFQYELEMKQYRDPLRQRYMDYADRLRDIGKHDCRFKVVYWCDRGLSIEELVGRL